ncbi:hypothetical protein EKH79_01235 [Dyella dinghuensis]|uniref:Uncharacterized protein n=1 Tax=Dyella dinghuensis TaxID=1920169 RepID=A0A432LYH6_9GAMM|nr:hypothetical protein [Dyella dinghuensis]RUL66483.1 hypothetical protein EKH79_01235 [Dyella dinghuensis]
MDRTKTAFLAAPLVASLVYWWMELVANGYRAGEPFAASLEFLALIAIFAYGWTLVAALPVYLVLQKIGLANKWPIFILGTVLGWLFIAYCNDGRPLLHPEGFAVGMIAACTFLLIRSGDERRISVED